MTNPTPIYAADLPACSSDACSQGKSECPTKAACWLPECEREIRDWEKAFTDLGWALLIVFIAAGFAALIFN